MESSTLARASRARGLARLRPFRRRAPTATAPVRRMRRGSFEPNRRARSDESEVEVHVRSTLTLGQAKDEPLLVTLMRPDEADSERIFDEGAPSDRHAARARRWAGARSSPPRRSGPGARARFSTARELRALAMCLTATLSAPREHIRSAEEPGPADTMATTGMHAWANASPCAGWSTAAARRPRPAQLGVPPPQDSSAHGRRTGERWRGSGRRAE